MIKLIYAFVLLSVLTTGAFAANNKKNIDNKVTTQSLKLQQSSTENQFSNVKVGNSFKNELFLNFSESKFSVGKNCKSCDSKMELSLIGSYLRHIQDKIQVGTEAGFIIRSGSGEHSGFQLIGVGVYNIDNNFSNSFYAKLGLGLDSITTSDSEFAFYVAGGKRFPIFSNLNYTPELRIIKTGDVPVNVELTILNVSVNWN